MAPLRILYVMDPMSRVLVDKDTTFAFQLEGQRRGHEQYHCEPHDLFVDRTVPHATVAPRRRSSAPTSTSGSTRCATAPLAFFDVVFMRKDPPFDMAYFFATHLLGLVDPAVTLVVNAPRGLREANEKLYALNFPDLIPESLVASQPARLRAFLDELGGEMIVKPLDGCGGAGVLHVQRDDRNLNALLELSTLDGTRLVMAQRYLPAARQGDKRLIVLDGEPLGGVLRIPRDDEHRGNIHVGGRVERDAGRRARSRDLPAHGAAAPRRRALVRRPRRHRRARDRGERHQPDGRPGDRPARRHLPRGARPRLRRGARRADSTARGARRR